MNLVLVAWLFSLLTLHTTQAQLCLQGFWAFEGSLFDSVGNVSATFSGPGIEIGRGRIGSGLNISQLGAYADVISNTPFQIADSVSASAWVFFAQNESASDARIISFGSPNFPGYELYYSSLRNRWVVSCFGGFAMSGPVFPNYQWVHLSFSCARKGPATLAQLYVNGTLVANQTFPYNDPTYLNLAFSFGRQPQIFNAMVGLLDEVRIYKGALNQQQVRALFGVSSAACGNGVWELPEQCDGGVNCTGACTCSIGKSDGKGGCAYCGNGIVDPCEECDGTWGCSSSCRCNASSVAFNGTCTGCGDGILQDSEECDGGIYCDSSCTCTPPGVRSGSVNCGYCGDLIRNPSEDCDETTPNCISCTCADQITANLTCNYCGDNIVAGLERCDSTSPTCNSTTCQCVPPYVPTNPPSGVCGVCGDGKIDSFEQCDGGTGCSVTCQCTGNYTANYTLGCGSCGNGIRDVGEECDGGLGCDLSCYCSGGYSVPTGLDCARCGDGILSPGEGCDSVLGCNNSTCTCLPGWFFGPTQGTCIACGNGIVEAGETCDSGFGCDPTSCSCATIWRGTSPTPSPSCSYCGDGIYDPSEECELGGVGCSSTCTCQAPYHSVGARDCGRCGDGQAVGTELCDGSAFCSPACFCLPGYRSDDIPHQCVPDSFPCPAVATPGLSCASAIPLQFNSSYLGDLTCMGITDSIGCPAFLQPHRYFQWFSFTPPADTTSFTVTVQGRGTADFPTIALWDNFCPGGDDYPYHSTNLDSIRIQFSTAVIYYISIEYSLPLAYPPEAAVFQLQISRDPQVIPRPSMTRPVTCSTALSYCGDGIVSPNEVCDGTGCRTDCTGCLAGYTPTYLPSLDGWGTTKSYSCTRCGDGRVLGDEECDSTNGCGSDCKCQPPSRSDGTGNCRICGNNLVEAGEECDGTPYCSDTCTCLPGTKASCNTCQEIETCPTLGFAQSCPSSESILVGKVYGFNLRCGEPTLGVPCTSCPIVVGIGPTYWFSFAVVPNAIYRVSTLYSESQFVPTLKLWRRSCPDPSSSAEMTTTGQLDFQARATDNIVYVAVGPSVETNTSLFGAAISVQQLFPTLVPVTALDSTQRGRLQGCSGATLRPAEPPCVTYPGPGRSCANPILLTFNTTYAFNTLCGDQLEPHYSCSNALDPRCPIRGFGNGPGYWFKFTPGALPSGDQFVIKTLDELGTGNARSYISVYDRCPEDQFYGPTFSGTVSWDPVAEPASEWFILVNQDVNAPADRGLVIVSSLSSFTSVPLVLPIVPSIQWDSVASPVCCEPVPDSPIACTVDEGCPDTQSCSSGICQFLPIYDPPYCSLCLTSPFGCQQLPAGYPCAVGRECGSSCLSVCKYSDVNGDAWDLSRIATSSASIRSSSNSYFAVAGTETPLFSYPVRPTGGVDWVNWTTSTIQTIDYVLLMFLSAPSHRLDLFAGNGTATKLVLSVVLNDRFGSLTYCSDIPPVTANAFSVQMTQIGTRIAALYSINGYIACGCGPCQSCTNISCANSPAGTLDPRCPQASPFCSGSGTCQASCNYPGQSSEDLWDVRNNLPGWPILSISNGTGDASAILGYGGTPWRFSDSPPYSMIVRTRFSMVIGHISGFFQEAQLANISVFAHVGATRVLIGTEYPPTTTALDVELCFPVTPVLTDTWELEFWTTFSNVFTLGEVNAFPALSFTCPDDCHSYSPETGRCELLPNSPTCPQGCSGAGSTCSLCKVDPYDQGDDFAWNILSRVDAPTMLSHPTSLFTPGTAVFQSLCAGDVHPVTLYFAGNKTVHRVSVSLTSRGQFDLRTVSRIVIRHPGGVLVNQTVPNYRTAHFCWPIGPIVLSQLTYELTQAGPGGPLVVEFNGYFTPQVPCVSNCTGRSCGISSCGGLCSTCLPGETCAANGQCQSLPCVPSCGNRTCGSNGCGGLCGNCPTGQVCLQNGCQTTPCANNCVGKMCGSDSCGGSCGSCTSRETCSNGQCVCVPQCFGKTCGPDGCGGSCGPCPLNGTYVCTPQQTCSCVPRPCGACGDNGCGVSCGTCLAFGVNAKCSNGACSCTPDCTGRVCGSDGCLGTCGPATACQNVSNPLGFCNELLGVCQCQPDCTGKSCGSDGCGGTCGTCPGTSSTCTGGACVCTPDCTGKACGDDGCGGTCGGCATPTSPLAVCTSGACTCTPPPSCQCGTNGCGGSCGTCQTGQDCVNGACVTIPASCVPRCSNVTYTLGTLTLGPCGSNGCGSSCGTCTTPAVCLNGQCTCVPDCTGKVCGPDGCGGFCGDCFAPAVCAAGQCSCNPSCGTRISGPDGCGGSCAVECVLGTIPCQGVFPYLCPTNGSGYSYNPSTGLCDCPPCASCSYLRNCRAVDGYLSGCTVCLDTSGDGACTSGEVTTTTDPDGTFQFSSDFYDVGDVLVEAGSGCIDTGTGLPIESNLRAVSSGESVTPLTNILASFPSSIPTQQRQRLLQNGFGFSGGYDINTFDPVQAVLDGIPGAREALVSIAHLEALLGVTATLALVKNGSVAQVRDETVNQLIVNLDDQFDDPTILSSIYGIICNTTRLSYRSDQLLIAAQTTVSLFSLITNAILNAENATVALIRHAQFGIVTTTLVRDSLSGYLNGTVNSTTYAMKTSATALNDTALTVVVPKLGCIDPRAVNYDPTAGTSDGSCISNPQTCYAQTTCSGCIASLGCFFCGGPVHVCLPEGFLPQGISGLDYCRLYLNGSRTFSCPTYNDCQELPNAQANACSCLGSRSPTTNSQCGYCETPNRTMCVNDMPDRFFGYGSFTKTVCENIGGVYRFPSEACATITPSPRAPVRSPPRPTPPPPDYQSTGSAITVSLLLRLLQ